MSRAIIEDHSLVVSPTLACKIGLNESIVLQQIHYWLETYKERKSTDHFYEDQYWIYNTYTDWKNQFPFWCERTIRRTIRSLEEKKLLINANYNKLKYDKTKWYTINYDALESLLGDESESEENRLDKLSASNRTDCPDGLGQNDQTNTIDYLPYTTSKSSSIDSPECIPTECHETDAERIKLNQPDIEDQRSGFFWKNEKMYNDYINKMLIKYLRNIFDRRYGKHEDEKKERSIDFWTRVFKMYFKYYRINRGAYHPWYRENNLEKVIENLFAFGMTEDREYNSVNSDCLEKYIKKFFGHKNLGCDYSMCVFSSEKMLTVLYGEIYEDYSAFDEINRGVYYG